MALIMDSLRYWVTDMHVDGFRFDLAPVLVRGIRGGPAQRLLRDHPAGPGPLQGEAHRRAMGRRAPTAISSGRFPPGWSEWNGAFRDCVRRFWRGDPGQVPELASRLTGSSDIYAPSGRRTYASVNFVTCHDGFTLTDLVSYERQAQRGQRRGQPRRGREQPSRNWGVEGPTDSARIQRVRDRMKRNFLATLFFSQGVRDAARGATRSAGPRTGNNNAVLPGQRDQLVRLGRRRDRHRPARLRPRPDRDRARQPHPSPARLLHRQARSRRPGAGTSRGSAPTAQR